MKVSYIVHGHNFALSVPDSDNYVLVNAVQQLVNDPALCERYRANAHRAALSLNWEAQEQGLLDLYARILPARSA